MICSDYPYFFNLKRSLQAACFLLKLEGGRMNYMRLLKLLYIADRESLQETGDAITGDAPYAMERGPVLTQIFDFLKGEHPDRDHWQKYIATKAYDAHLVMDPGTGSLCQYDSKKLKEISERYSLKDEWDMVNICHELEEWRKNDPGKSSKPIPFEDILNAVGRGEYATKIRKEASAYAKLDKRLALIKK